MKRIIHSLVPVLFLAAAQLVRAESMLIPVTPGDTHEKAFTFDITFKALSGGMVEFRVVVSERKGTFVDPSTGLHTVLFTETTSEIKGGRALPQEKKDKSITCVFTVPEKALADPNLCFVFTNEVKDSRGRLRSSSDIYYARLKDFFKKQ